MSEDASTAKMPTAETAEMRKQLNLFKSALSSFSSSSSNFRVLSTIPTAAGSSKTVHPSTLYVLDSSFNPPTRAHLQIAKSALTHDHGARPKRLLLLLATQNADKAPKPASFEHRLVLMNIFAADLLQAIREQKPEGEALAVDIGVTKFPYFTDKAAAIQGSGAYDEKTEQVHLTGYDTLIRIMDPKYYPPEHTLAPLEPFLSQHRLRVTYRTAADWGEKNEQDEYLKEISNGERESDGAKKEWGEKIELVEGRKEGEQTVSSTKVREAMKKGNEAELKTLVTDGVADYILQENLYKDE